MKNLLLPILVFIGAGLSAQITNFNPTSYTVNDPWQIVDSDVDVNSTVNFDEGFLQFEVTNLSDNSDEFRIKSDPNPNAVNAISETNGTVFLGDGSGKEVIGSVDAVNDGTNGKPLRINFVANFSNSSFENGLSGWTIIGGRVDLGSTVIAGFTSPESFPYPGNTNNADNNPPQSNFSYNYQFSSNQKTDGNQSLRLYSNGTTGNGCDVVHGPAVYSSTFTASQNDVIYFDWRAINGSDDYDVFGYILNVNNGNTTEVINANGGQTSWTTAQATIPANGDYKFVFVNGTHDRTCGLAAGASLYIDNVRVFGSKVDDQVLETLIEKVEFQSLCGDNNGDRTVEITTENQNGSQSTVSGTMTVNSLSSPVITAPADTVITTDQGVCTVTNPDIGISNIIGSCATDANDVPSVLNLGSVVVNWTATNTYGQTGSDQQNVTVVDSELPVVNTKNTTVYLDANGQATISTSDIEDGSTDNCSVDTYSLDKTTFDCNDVGVDTVNLTVTDANNNSAVASATVTVIDTISPVAQAQNITVQLDANGQAIISTSDIDNGSIDNCTSPTLSLDKTTFDCNDLGTNTVTLTSTDPANNSSSATAVVTVEDNTAPSAISQDITVYLDANGQASITTNDIDNGSSDNCSISSMTLDQTSFTCADTGQNTVTLTVTDGSNNVSTSSAVVTVLDTISPNALAQDISLYLDANGQANITTSDIDNGSGDNCSMTLSLDQTSFDCSDVGTNNVTLTATDGSNNTSTATSIVTVIDTISPVVQAQNITVQLDANGQAIISTSDIDNGSIDNCTSPTLSLDKTTFDCNDLGPNTVTLTSTDPANNSSSATAVVTVEDNTAPSAISQDITVYLDANGQAGITTNDIDNGSSDNCSISSMTLDQTSFTCADTGQNTVTLTVTDGSNNVSTSTAVVTVEDTIAPNIQTQSVTLYLDSLGQASTTVTSIDAGSIDNCGIDTMFLSESNFDCSHIGTNTVQLIATDVNGNTDSSSAVVTVEDTIAPEVITQGVTLHLDSTGTAVLTPSVFDNGSNDNCSIDSMSLSQDTFTCSDLGLHVVDLHVTDQSGNGATSNALVSVTDTIAPLLRSFSNITVYLDSSGTASIDAGMLDSNSVDNCSLDTIYLSRTTLACADLGSTSVELIGKDRSMNESRLLVNITVEDTIAPSIECPSSFDACAGIVDFPDAVSNDNCTSTVTNTGNVFSGDSLTEGEYVTSFEAVDEAGNVASCTTSFSVNAIPEVDLGADTAVGPGHVVSFSVNDTVNEYLWSTGDTTMSLDIKVLTDTTVWVSVTDSNRCTGSDTATVTILTGVNGAEKTVNVSVYPNPTRGDVKIELLGAENMNYHLIDMSGRILQSGNIQTGLNRIDLSRYASSIYYLHLQNMQGDGSKVIRLVKQ